MWLPREPSTSHRGRSPLHDIQPPAIGSSATAASANVAISFSTRAAALLLAERLAPGVTDRCIAGHRSTEPGATVALRHLGLEPVLDLGLRLGEGTGACLAVPVVGAAARVLNEMATFAEAAVADDPIAGG